MNKTLFTGFAPNMDKTDIAIAMSFLLLPWKWSVWKNGKAPALVEKKLVSYLNIQNVIALDSGRTALYAALKALKVGKGDEVIVQAFTCVVVINAITSLGANVVYVDINNEYNADPKDIEKAITNKTKVIIIQHTFGTPAKVDTIVSLAKKHSIATIEDCAHALGVTYKEKKLGSFADMAIFSFGSDKVISSVRGGALATSDSKLAAKVRKFSLSLPATTSVKIFQHLIQYPIFYLGKKLYHLGIGKMILAFAKKIHLLYRFVYHEEKQGRVVNFFPSTFSNALATIAVHQIDTIDSKNKHRKSIAKIYAKKLENCKGVINNNFSIYLRYPLQVNNPAAVHLIAKKANIILGNWYDTVIAPRDIDINKTGYISGSCPRAEAASKSIINLPTNKFITESDANRISTIIKEVL